jgi:transcriptional regulator with XRE-family HTH domain
MPDRSYSAVLARNVKAARTRRDLKQDVLAVRMKALGYDEWIRQTVSNVEQGKRRLTAEEVFGLSVALDVSVTSLMFPGPDDEPLVELRGGQLIAVPVQWALSTAPSGSVIWDGGKPKFSAPSDKPDDLDA